MILPIRTLFGRQGLPGGGVPAMVVNPTTGQIIGGPGANGSGGGVLTDRDIVELWDGRPDTDAGDGADSSDSSRRDWSGSILRTADLNNTHGGPVWSRSGNYRDESAFDRWRRAGKPTDCGMGDWAQVLQDALNAGATSVVTSSYPPGTVIEEGPNGPIVYPPGYYPGVYRGSGVPLQGQGGAVTVAGSASNGAWIFGVVIVGALVWGLARK